MQCPSSMVLAGKPVVGDWFVPVPGLNGTKLTVAQPGFVAATKDTKRHSKTGRR